MNEDTQEVPLPEGVARNPDATTTQELPVVDPFPDVKLVSPVKVVLPSMAKTVRVETLPPRLLGDPILTAPEPVMDETPLYDQINGAPERRKPRQPRRKMPVGDKVLFCMGAAAIVMTVGTYGMVVNGWGAGDFPEEKAASAPQKPAPATSEPQEPEETTSAPRPARSPEKAPVELVAAPQTYTPKPERSIVVVKPTPTPERTTAPPVVEEPPAPAPTHSSAPPRPSGTPAPPTPDPTPTTASPTPTFSVSVPPPVTQSQSLSAPPSEEDQPSG